MLEAKSDTLIKLGPHDLRIEIPDRGLLENQFQANLTRHYQQHIVQATPNLHTLRVNAPCSDITPLVRRINGITATYVIENKIGSGASSSVHQVCDAQTGKAFAAKLFTTDNIVRRQQEVTILQKLSHVRTHLALV